MKKWIRKVVRKRVKLERNQRILAARVDELRKLINYRTDQFERERAALQKTQEHILASKEVWPVYLPIQLEAQGREFQAKTAKLEQRLNALEGK